MYEYWIYFTKEIIWNVTGTKIDHMLENTEVFLCFLYVRMRKKKNLAKIKVNLAFLGFFSDKFSMSLLLCTKTYYFFATFYALSSHAH